MSDYMGSRAGGFQEIVPWADPYIASLVEKMRRWQEGDGETLLDAVDELQPPLDNDEPDRDEPWQADWSPRNWPRETRGDE